LVAITHERWGPVGDIRIHDFREPSDLTIGAETPVNTGLPNQI